MTKQERVAAIQPELIGGFLDFLPSTMIARQAMLDTIREVYERFGFVPLETPAVEKLSVLTGNNPNFTMLLYRTAVVRGLKGLDQSSFEGEDQMALRFDLTVPLARVVSAYPDRITKPFKRYQVGKVWRGEKPQAGRFREFYQFDADIVGSRSMMADAEIICLMAEVMKALGLSDFLIRVSDRKVLEGLNSLLGLTDEAQRTEVMRIVDKREKVGNEEVKIELSREPVHKYDPAPNLSSEQADRVMDFLDIKQGGEEALESASSIVGSVPIGAKGIAELREIASYLDVLGVSRDNWCIDLSIARGLDYYTGPVFETTLGALPELGSVYSGGRFDGLTDRFIPGSNIPGTGASVGVDRLFAAMQQLGKFEAKFTVTKVLIASLDPSLNNEYLKIVKELREAGIPSEVYLAEDPLKKQLGYAAKKRIPFMIILGPDEFSKGVVALRNMDTRSQETMGREALTDRLKQVI
jgi:histidyl-tRNA synthetase